MKRRNRSSRAKRSTYGELISYERFRHVAQLERCSPFASNLLGCQLSQIP